MEGQTGEPKRKPSPVTQVMIRIDKRVDRTLANPNLTKEQEMKLFVLANLSKLALSLGSPLGLHFAQELINHTDPLMIPEKTTP